MADSSIKIPVQIDGASVTKALKEAEMVYFERWQMLKAWIRDSSGGELPLMVSDALIDVLKKMEELEEPENARSL